MNLSRSGASNRISLVDQDAPSPRTDSSSAAPSILKSLSDFVPTEVVALFLPGISIITSTVRYTGGMWPGATYPFQNTQAFWAWAWFYLCCLLTVAFYYLSFALSWRQEKGGALPRAVDLFTGIAIYQVTAALLAFIAWGLSIAPTGVLLWPSVDGAGTDPHPFAALVTLVLSPLFATINQLITYRPSSSGVAA